MKFVTEQRDISYQLGTRFDSRISIQISGVESTSSRLRYKRQLRASQFYWLCGVRGQEIKASKSVAAWAMRQGLIMGVKGFTGSQLTSQSKEQHNLLWLRLAAINCKPWSFVATGLPSNKGAANSISWILGLEKPNFGLLRNIVDCTLLLKIHAQHSLNTPVKWTSTGWVFSPQSDNSILIEGQWLEHLLRVFKLATKVKSSVG